MRGNKVYCFCPQSNFCPVHQLTLKPFAEAQSAVCVGAAQRLHMQVADIAAEHHKTVLALSAQCAQLA
eukprot:2743773-Amphidinium_carterae.1